MEDNETMNEMKIFVSDNWWVIITPEYIQTPGNLNPNKAEWTRDRYQNYLNYMLHNQRVFQQVTPEEFTNWKVSKL